jgi:hypothetical protein
MVIYGKNCTLKYHTRLADVLPALHGYHIPLTWMLTNLECNFSPEVLLTDEPIIISGEDLDALIQERPNLQVIWGVLSGFRLPREEIDLSILPKSEDSDVWKSSYQIQHPQAECELVAWDSTATFFRSRNQKAMEIFSGSFPEAQTLEAFWETHN